MTRSVEVVIYITNTTKTISSNPMPKKYMLKKKSKLSTGRVKGVTALLAGRLSGPRP